MRLNLKQKNRLKKLVAGTALVVLAGFVYYIIVRFFNLSIPCPLRFFTGIVCPGCGTTRMVMAILRFDFKAAFSFQPVLFCALIPLAVCFSAMAVNYVKKGTKTLYLWQNIIVYTTIVALLVYCVYVNAINIINHIN